MTVEQAVVALEREGWRALAAGRGRDFYEEVLLDDAVMVFPVGAFGKAESLQGLAGAAPWDAYELRDVRVVHPVEGTATVVYSVVADRKGQPAYRALMSSTYVCCEGKWRLALHTQTPVAG